MLRFTVTLAVLVATLVTSNELMAQRRAPLRSLAQQVGFRWGTGNHVRNPGPTSNYYSPWSDHNTADHQWRPATTTTPESGSYFDDAGIRETPAVENSATQLLPQTRNNRWIQPTGQSSIRIQSDDRQSIDTSWQDNQRINRTLQPWQSAAVRSGNGQIIGGSSGQFIPARDRARTGYEQQFENSRPFAPGNR